MFHTGLRCNTPVQFEYRLRDLPSIFFSLLVSVAYWLAYS